MLMKTRIEQVDLHAVDEKHEAIHKRLENWARWCHGGGGSGGVAPMFRMYRPDNFERGPIATPVDGTDAQRIAKGIQALPQPHRVALNWFYVKPTNPRRACQNIGTSMEGLATHVRHGRIMLINRKI
jgi:hypothetical protein